MKENKVRLFTILIILLIFANNVLAETFLFEGGEWEEDIKGDCPEFIGSVVNSWEKDNKWVTSNAELYETIVFQPIQESSTLLTVRMKSKYKNAKLVFFNKLIGNVESIIDYEVEYKLYYSSDPGNEPLKRTYFTSKTYDFNGKQFNYGGKDILHWRGQGEFKIDNDSYYIDMVNLEQSVNCVTEFDPEQNKQKGKIGKFEVTVTKLLSLPICESQTVEKTTNLRIQ